MAKKLEALQSTERVIVPEALTGFLNHGILPFTGRSREIEMLVQFWHQAPDEQGLQAALVLGEAGMGKSRVIDELIPHITHNGGIVLRVKLFTGSTLSLAQLLAKAIRTNLGVRTLLAGHVEDTIGSVTTALQRLVKLRPALLVIEDIHWLPAELLMELAGFLEGMSQEYLRVVFLARPVVFDARGIIERYLTTEIAMKGLNAEEVEALWERLFISRGEEECIRVLHEISGGNPLALRSALRGAVHSKLIGIESMGGSRWKVLCPLPVLKSNISRFVEVLSDGLAAHLTSQELDSARQLAALGEIVSPEAAAIMIDNSKLVIEQLIHKGILVPMLSVSLEIEKEFEQSAYGFTHTLLHRHLLKQSSGSSAQLMRILAENIPIHSIQPFEQLQGVSLEQIPDDSIAAAFDNWVKRPPDIWVSHGTNAATIILNFLEWLLDVAPVSVANFRHREMYLRLTSLMLINMRSELINYQGQVRRYAELTQNPTTIVEAEQYLYACCYMMSLEGEQTGKIPLNWWDEWQATVAKFPDWRNSTEYILILAACLHNTYITSGDFSVLQICEKEIMEMISNEEYSMEFHQHIVLHLSVYYINLFRNQQEYDHRILLIKQFQEAMAGKEWAITLFIRNYMPFLFSTGQFRDFQKMLTSVIPLLISRQLKRGQNQWSYWAKLSDSAFGVPIQSASHAAEPYRTSEHVFPSAQHRLAKDTVLFSILLDEYQWAGQYMHQHEIELSEIDLSAQILILYAEDQVEKISAIEFSRHLDGLFGQLCQAFSANADIATIIDHFSKIYNKPVLRVHDVLIIQATNCLLKLIEQQHGIAPIQQLHQGISDNLASTLQWLKSRNLIAFIPPFLKSYAGILDPDFLIQQSNSIKKESAEVLSNENVDGAKPIQITVLGEITVQKVGSEPLPLRGARNRTLLALLVAVQTMRRPPSAEDFYELASGVAGDASYAQHMTRNAMSRLKGLVGKNSIVRRSGLPRLNMDIVHVDIIEIQQELQQILKLIGEGEAFQAYSLTKNVLASIGTKVLYPTQYEPFFEIARENFENSLRNAILSVARLLIEERDHDHAEIILQSGIEVLPQDQEVVDRLAEVLVALNRSAEAERLLAEMEYR